MTNWLDFILLFELFPLRSFAKSDISLEKNIEAALILIKIKSIASISLLETSKNKAVISNSVKVKDTGRKGFFHSYQ